MGAHSMSTINGFGTLRYDWAYHPDGTAEATEWLVAGFLPVVPLKRERFRVQSVDPDASSPSDIALSVLGFNKGFASQFEVLGRVPLRLAGVLKTYFFGYVVTPLLLVGVPLFLAIVGRPLLEMCGLNWRQYGDYVIGVFGIILIFYVGAVVATILDRCAGRNANRWSSASPPSRNKS
jgi:hypothetical protein